MREGFPSDKYVWHERIVQDEKTWRFDFFQIQRHIQAIIHLDYDKSTRLRLTWDILQQFPGTFFTWDGYVLPNCRSSCKVAKEGATRKHQIARSWKLIRNADKNIPSSQFEPLCASVENLNFLNGDCCSIVNGNPRQRFILREAIISSCTVMKSLVRSLGVSIDTLGCSKKFCNPNTKFRFTAVLTRQITSYE